MPTKQPNLYGLTLKQSLFVSEYMKDRNATQAAIRAGYNPKSADSMGWSLLKNPKVQEAIAERTEAAENRSQVTVDRVLLELSRIAFADTTKVAYIEGGRLKVADTKDLDTDTRAAISEISQSTGNTVTTKVRLHDKIRALELIGRHLAMFKDKLDVDAGETIVGILGELRRRREAATGGGSGEAGR